MLRPTLFLTPRQLHPDEDHLGQSDSAQHEQRHYDPEYHVSNDVVCSWAVVYLLRAKPISDRLEAVVEVGHLGKSFDVVENERML